MRSGLLFLNNRYHDPTLGTFISVDPLVTQTGEAYIYASGNPATLSDPTGLKGCDSNRRCPNGPSGRPKNGSTDLEGDSAFVGPPAPAPSCSEPLHRLCEYSGVDIPGDPPGLDKGDDGLTNGVFQILIVGGDPSIGRIFLDQTWEGLVQLGRLGATGGSWMRWNEYSDAIVLLVYSDVSTGKPYDHYVVDAWRGDLTEVERGRYFVPSLDIGGQPVPKGQQSDPTAGFSIELAKLIQIQPVSGASVYLREGEGIDRSTDFGLDLSGLPFDWTGLPSSVRIYGVLG